MASLNWNNFLKCKVSGSKLFSKILIDLPFPRKSGYNQVFHDQPGFLTQRMYSAYLEFDKFYAILKFSRNLMNLIKINRSLLRNNS